MNTGGLDGPYLQSGRVNDRSSIIQEKPLPKGAIRIADLGYFSCEFYAKLLAMLIQHWILLSGFWRFPNRSLTKAAQTVRKHAQNLAVSFASKSRERLLEALEIISHCLALGCRLNKRRAKPNTYQLLLEVTGDD
jgi:hypothetical protein